MAVRGIATGRPDMGPGTIASLPQLPHHQPQAYTLVFIAYEATAEFGSPISDFDKKFDINR
jgi:hypothetical protein